MESFERRQQKKRVGGQRLDRNNSNCRENDGLILKTFTVTLYTSIKMCAKLLQLCLTLCNSMDCSPPGSSVCGILQARILEWVAVASSRGPSPPRDQTHVSCIAKEILYCWATREAPLWNVLGDEGILPFRAYYEHNQKSQLCFCGQKLFPVRFIPIKRAIIYEEKMIRVFHITNTVFQKLKGSRRSWCSETYFLPWILIQTLHKAAISPFHSCLLRQKYWVTRK